MKLPQNPTVERFVVSSSSIRETLWRTEGTYAATLAGKSSLLDESRLLLEAYAQSGDVQTACQALTDTLLPQRSRETRTNIVQVLRMRLFRWHPPSWVLADLISFARTPDSDAFPLAMLLHIARQDPLLYNFIQDVVVPRWNNGMTNLTPSDVQRFMDADEENHPEVNSWSYATREKVSQNTLKVLRDCKLLKGEVKKQIVLPTVPPFLTIHLIRLLEAEGIAQDKIAQHLDWQIWLLDISQVQKALDSYANQEHTV